MAHAQLKVLRHGQDENTPQLESGAYSSLTDRIMALTLQYSAANTPVAKWTASSERFSPPMAV
jgi:hypothetical protein